MPGIGGIHQKNEDEREEGELWGVGRGACGGSAPSRYVQEGWKVGRWEEETAVGKNGSPGINVGSSEGPR